MSPTELAPIARQAVNAVARYAANADRADLVQEAWLAMLVALPSAIAFGVTIFAPLGGTYAAYGALAGILGVTALGLVASALGGTNRLITALASYYVGYGLVLLTGIA